ncbi:MAG: hypothetical protein V7L31_24400 [Nostoc sp.]
MASVEASSACLQISPQNFTNPKSRSARWIVVVEVRSHTLLVFKHLHPE